MTVTGVAQVKLFHDQHEIKRIVLPTFEGHLSVTLSTWTVEEACKARAQFASLFSKNVQPYVG